MEQASCFGIAANQELSIANAALLKMFRLPLPPLLLPSFFKEGLKLFPRKLVRRRDQESYVFGKPFLPARSCQYPISLN